MEISLKDLQDIGSYVAIFFLYILLILFIYKFEQRGIQLLNQKIKDRLIATILIFSVIGIVLFLVGFAFSEILKTPFDKLFSNFVIFIVSIYIIRSIFRILSKSVKFKILNYSILIIIFILSYIKILLKGTIDEIFILAIEYIQKFLIVLVILIVVLELIKLIKNRDLRNFLKQLALIVAIAFLLSWEFGYISLSFKTIVGFSLLLGITSLYYYLNSKLLAEFINFVKKYLPRTDVEAIEFNLRILVATLYFVIIKNILETFLNLSPIFNYLSKIYIIKNELISISIYSIFQATVLGIILFSLLNVVKKLVKIFFSKRDIYVEGGSAEVFIFNIGVLFNIMILMSSLGITWKIILPIAGTLGIGLGFGLQTIMNNYVSGFILMFSRRIKVGDIVELPSISVNTLGSQSPSIFGRIENIGILSTIIRTNDGVDIAIPNSDFINSPIINFSLIDPYVRLRIPIGVAYSSDPYTVREILLSVIDEVQTEEDKKIDKGKDVWFQELADSALIFTAVFWIHIRKDIKIMDIISKFYYTAWYKLKENNIEIPFPQNDIWFRNKLRVEIDYNKEIGLVR